MIGRAAEIFAVFRVKSRDFQRKSVILGFFKMKNSIIDNCFHGKLVKIIFFSRWVGHDDDRKNNFSGHAVQRGLGHCRDARPLVPNAA